MELESFWIFDPGGGKQDVKLVKLRTQVQEASNLSRRPKRDAGWLPVEVYRLHPPSQSFMVGNSAIVCKEKNLQHCRKGVHVALKV